MRIVRYAEADLPTHHGPLRLYVYRDAKAAEAGGTAEEHMAIVKGDVAGKNDVLARVHSECWTGEVLGSMKCDCLEQFEAALERIAAEPAGGVMVYLRQEGRGIGLGNKIRAYALQNRGADTVEANLRLGFDADARSYDVAADILNDLGVRSVRLMTNNPLKVAGLEAHGIAVSQRLDHWVGENEHNAGYLAVKRRKMGHHPSSLLRLVPLVATGAKRS